ncbi:hypothetical protein [Reyranella sp.]|uniref:hypothetical protein n=1 Tax=Reyranella sp. TaxID=1929291 RepID=UPI00271B5AFF|nr:hypothetical protein [Reyranella sp.]MDO8973228.1 hypothetical protein [Reyranella sp.]
MLDTPSTDFTDFDSWHPSGWSPVYDRVTSLRHLVGFTTQQCRLVRLMIAQETGDEDGAFAIVGEARVALAGEFDSWVVETGDYHVLPGFWAL